MALDTCWCCRLLIVVLLAIECLQTVKTVRTAPSRRNVPLIRRGNTVSQLVEVIKHKHNNGTGPHERTYCDDFADAEKRRQQRKRPKATPVLSRNSSCKEPPSEDSSRGKKLLRQLSLKKLRNSSLKGVNQDASSPHESHHCSSLPHEHTHAHAEPVSRPSPRVTAPLVHEMPGTFEFFKPKLPNSFNTELDHSHSHGSDNGDNRAHPPVCKFEYCAAQRLYSPKPGAPRSSVLVTMQGPPPLRSRVVNIVKDLNAVGGGHGHSH